MSDDERLAALKRQRQDEQASDLVQLLRHFLTPERPPTVIPGPGILTPLVTPRPGPNNPEYRREIPFIGQTSPSADRRDYSTIELPDVPSPYPFKNPMTPTRDVDAQLRQIRSIAPGAGTNLPAIAPVNPNDRETSLVHQLVHAAQPPNYQHGEGRAIVTQKDLAAYQDLMQAIRQAVVGAKK